MVGDAARKDKDGYFWIIGRIDDVVNVSGHRLSTAEVESAIVSHGKVAESAVIGQADEDTGQAICAFVTLEGDLEGTDELIEEIRAASPTGSASSPGPSGSSGPTICPRRARARSCAACCATSPRAARSATSRRLRDPDVMSQLEGKIKEEQAAGMRRRADVARAEPPLGACPGPGFLRPAVGGQSRQRSPQTLSRRPSSVVCRRATGIVWPSANVSSAVPPSIGRSSTAWRRLATYWRWTRTKPSGSQRRSISASVNAAGSARRR